MFVTGCFANTKISKDFPDVLYSDEVLLLRLSFLCWCILKMYKRKRDPVRPLVFAEELWNIWNTKIPNPFHVFECESTACQSVPHQHVRVYHHINTLIKHTVASWASLWWIYLLGSALILLRRFKLAHTCLSIVVNQSSDVRKWIHCNLFCRETRFVYFTHLQSCKQ